MSKLRSAPWLAYLMTAAATMYSSLGLPQPRAFPVVTAVEQAHRDSDRLRILQTELSSEEASVQAAALRRAERLVAGDKQGVHVAEQAYVQHLSNIAALRREIASTTGIRRVGSPGKTAPRERAMVDSSDAEVPLVEKPPKRSAPWWDVYQRRSAPRSVSGLSSTSPDRATAANHRPVLRAGAITPRPWSVYREDKD